MNIPNLLTVIRLSLVPVMVFFFYLPYSWADWIVSGIFFVAGITDWFDGFLARRLNQITAFGAFLDPVADKLIVSIALTLLVQRYGHFWLTIPAIIIIGREIIISALREWMAEIGRSTILVVTHIAKIKTLAQMGSIFFLLLAGAPPYRTIFYGWVAYLGVFLLYVAAILTLLSMYFYLKVALPRSGLLKKLFRE